MAQVEKKVSYSSVATYVASTAALAVLAAVSDAGLVAELPDAVEPFVLALVPAVTNFLVGYKTRNAPKV